MQDGGILYTEKIVKNSHKWVKYIFWSSHMIKNNIWNIFSFSSYSFSYLLNPFFWANFSKFGEKKGLYKYQTEKTKKLKLLQMLLFKMYDDQKICFTHFWPFFDPFYCISLLIFAIMQNSPILHFRDTTGYVRLGK